MRRSSLLPPGRAAAGGERDLPQMRARLQRRDGGADRAEIRRGEKAQRPSRGAGKLSRIAESTATTQAGGRHGQRSDAQQQGKEKTEAGQEQAERRSGAVAIRRRPGP